MKNRYTKYLDKGVSITLREECEICHDRHCPVDLRLECGHYYHKECLMHISRYRTGDKYDESKHKCRVCQRYISVDHVIRPLVDHLTPDQLNVYEFCAKCHNFRDPTLFVGSICDYCNSNNEIHKQLKIFNCPNCGLELIKNGGCMGMVCCLYGGHCRGTGCYHGTTSNIRFCGHSWSLKHSICDENEWGENEWGENE